LKKRKVSKIHPALVLCPFFILTPLAYLRHFLIYALSYFGLTPFGWLLSITLTPNYPREYYFSHSPSLFTSTLFSRTQLKCATMGVYVLYQIPNPVSRFHQNEFKNVHY